MDAYQLSKDTFYINRRQLTLIHLFTTHIPSMTIFSQFIEIILHKPR